MSSSAAAGAAAAPPASTIDTVQLDGLVLLKIINHCKESMPDVVSGQLLGLDTGSTPRDHRLLPPALLPVLVRRGQRTSWR